MVTVQIVGGETHKAQERENRAQTKGKRKEALRRTLNAHNTSIRRPLDFEYLLYLRFIKKPYKPVSKIDYTTEP
jgi:hypothetical protein